MFLRVNPVTRSTVRFCGKKVLAETALTVKMITIPRSVAKEGTWDFGFIKVEIKIVFNPKSVFNPALSTYRNWPLHKYRNSEENIEFHSAGSRDRSESVQITARW